MSDALGTGHAAPGDASAAFASLRGLALGDRFGERWFFHQWHEAIEMVAHRTTPGDKPWNWTDDGGGTAGLGGIVAAGGWVKQVRRPPVG